jgi:RNA polymerase sigma-70 factor (ECF subfamily)
MMRDQSEVLDGIQNAVLRAYRAFDRYHDDASFRAWMFKILTNEIFSINRKRGRIAKHEIPTETDEMETLAEAPLADEPGLFSSWEALADALNDDVVRALDALNGSERAVLLMRAIGGMHYREISECMGIPIGSVMGYLFRARRNMRDAIVRARGRTTP